MTIEEKYTNILDVQVSEEVRTLERSSWNEIYVISSKRKYYQRGINNFMVVRVNVI